MKLPRDDDDYKYGEAHVISSIRRAERGDVIPSFVKIDNNRQEDYAIDFTVSTKTRRNIHAHAYRKGSTEDFVKIRVYLELPERYTVRFLTPVDLEDSDAVFKTSTTKIFEKVVFSKRIVAAPEAQWLVMFETVPFFESVVHRVISLTLPENPNNPASARDMNRVSDGSADEGEI